MAAPTYATRESLEAHAELDNTRFTHLDNTIAEMRAENAKSHDELHEAIMGVRTRLHDLSNAVHTSRATFWKQLAGGSILIIVGIVGYVLATNFEKMIR